MEDIVYKLNFVVVENNIQLKLELFATPDMNKRDDIPKYR